MLVWIILYINKKIVYTQNACAFGFQTYGTIAVPKSELVRSLNFGIPLHFQKKFYKSEHIARIATFSSFCQLDVLYHFKFCFIKQSLQQSVKCSSMVSIAAFGPRDPGSNPGRFAVSNSNQKLSFHK